MKTALCLVLAMLAVSLTNAAVADIGGIAHGGEDIGAKGVGAGGSGGAGYGGRKGGVLTSGYDRGFSYGKGHDTGKTVSLGDEEVGGKGFGDKGITEFGLRGLGYGGLGYGGFRAPLFFFR